MWTLRSSGSHSSRVTKAMNGVLAGGRKEMRGSLHCASRDETARGYGRDDVSFRMEEEERFVLCANVPLIARDRGAMNGAPGSLLPRHHFPYPSPSPPQKRHLDRSIAATIAMRSGETPAFSFCSCCCLLLFVIPEGYLRLFVCSAVDQTKVPTSLLTNLLLEANSHRLNILHEGVGRG
jgi:hypothetical protein